ncbi:MAG: hypothetical protein IPK19_34700 [Chloroflexi bacterium]|nr:hypothetical protein [Chloroflexota bacterium]
MRMRLMLALTLAVLVGACQELPIFVVVTATPDPTETVLDLTRDAAVTLVAQAQGTLQPALPTQALPTPAPTTAAPTVTEPTAQPTRSRPMNRRRCPRVSPRRSSRRSPWRSSCSKVGACSGFSRPASSG